MNEKKYESTFIPCGDALEKMELFFEDALEKATGIKNIQEIEMKDSE